MSIASTARIFPNVHFGENVVVEDFCVIGCPPDGRQPGELETVIGDGAVIRAGTIIYAGNRIGARFHAGNKANIRELNEIGDHFSLGALSVLEHHIRIGSHVRIHTQSVVGEYTVIKDHCWVGPHVVITNAKYLGSPSAKDNLEPPVLEERCRIGGNVTILPGVVIGANSLVGAGSVVYHNVAPGTAVLGNPARFAKRVSDLPYS